MRNFSSETFSFQYNLKMVGHVLGLLKYFKACSKNSCDLPLPNLVVSLSKTLNRSTIEAASNEVTIVVADSLLHSIAASQ